MFCRLVGTNLQRQQTTQLDVRPAFGESPFPRYGGNEIGQCAAALADSALQPHDALTSLYGSLVSHRYSPEEDRLVACNKTRKQLGSFFTPRAVARGVVEAALEALPSGTDLPRVLDPAMGTGVFLVEAALCLSRRAGLSASLVAESVIFGADIDPVATELAILSLHLETGARTDVLKRHLRCLDMVGRPGMTHDRWDVVVGNPPWGARYSSARQGALRERWPESTKGFFDSFKLFLDLGSTVTRGSLGMIVPQAVLAQSTHADIRSLLLKRMAPYSAARLGGEIFPQAAAPACVLVCGPKPGPNTVVRLVRLERAGSKAVTERAIPAAHWSVDRFALDEPEVTELVRRLLGCHPAFGELSGAYRIRDVGLNYNRAAAAQRIFYTGERSEDPRDLARYRGRNFDRYTRVKPGGWLRHNARDLLQPGETLSGDWVTYQLPRKIVFRQTADRMVGTLDRSQMAMGRSVMAITAEKQVSLPAMLALLNSRLFTLLYRSVSGEEGRILPQVKAGTLKQLPIPQVCSLSPHEVATRGQSDAGSVAWMRLHHLAERLLRVEGHDPAALDEVDRVVCSLYGLREEEISLVTSE